MAFKMRTTKPEAGNKYYITKANGGWSNAIKGNSKNRDKDCDVLPNCFDGDTKFITSDGIKTLRECENKNVKVLSEDGLFRNAIVKSFGEQKLYKITFNNGNSYLATANHRWVVDRLSSWGDKKYCNRKIKTTLELNKSDYFPYVVAQHTFEIDDDGIRHGFIFGDGSLCHEKRYARASLCGFKRDYMYEWFKNSKNIYHLKNGAIEASPYPKEYKELPPLSKGQSYLRGFICGYLASDGCVDDDGSVRISCAKQDVLEYVKDICAIIGIRTGKIRTEYRKGYGEFETPLYHICLYRETIDSDMLLNPIHKTRFMSVKSKNIKYTKIKSVEDTDIVTTVYCVQEPETHTMVLEDNILTGQCVGYAYGRFNEIGGYGYCKYLTPTNAENFIKYKNTDLKVGQIPKLGACMVWQKGNTLSGSDGAGHVAIVEKVVSDTEVYTSESGWGSSKPFWNQTRKKGSGNWGQKDTYKFLGFIYNPAVTDVPNNQTADNDKASTNVAETTNFKYKVGDIVKFTGNTHYVSPDAITSKQCKAGVAKVTSRANGEKHPYHLIAENGKGSTVHGWVNEADIAGKVSNTSNSTTTKPKIKVDSAQSLLKSLAGTYQTTTELNMRAGAGTSNAILTVIPKGAKVTCYGYYTTVNSTKWYYVIYQNSKGIRFTGFVSSKYLKK